MDELTKIKGIGPATAKKLVAVGIDSVAALAAADPAAPIDGIAQDDWQAFIAEAKAAMSASEGEPEQEPATEAQAEPEPPANPAEPPVQEPTGEAQGDTTTPEPTPEPGSQDNEPAKPAPKDKGKAKGFVCISRVRFNGKSYEPGDHLPADVPDTVIARFKETGAIAR